MGMINVCSGVTGNASLKTLDKDDFSIILFSGNSQNTQDILIYLLISKTKALIQSVVTIYL